MEFENTEAVLKYQRHLKHKMHVLYTASQMYKSQLFDYQTVAEIKFSSLLKELDIDYIEQYIILTNTKFFIADFYIPTLHLIVELDGSQHYTEEGKAKDKRRDGMLKDFGFNKVLRFENKEVFNLSSQILKEILFRC
jgi:very-short-patch-repair endonuclease